MNNKKTIPAISFQSYLFKIHGNRIRLGLAVIAVIVQFAVFKFFYPYASFIHGDSFAYLETAHLNLDVNVYMVGYSRFLRLFSVFSTSDLILAAFQYLVIQASAVYLLFTLFYYYRPGRIVQLILLGFIVLNPLFLYLGNLVSSDGIFLALSFTWFALLLHITHRPDAVLIGCHSAVLFVAFTMRYNALLYPMIALPIFLLSKQQIRKKLAGLGIGMLACGTFIVYTGNKFDKITGTWQYAPFSGWLMANNAMYAYRYVDSAKRKPVPARFQALDNMIRTYFDSSRNVKTHPEEGLVASTVYMWSPTMPLYRFRNQVFEKDSTATELKKWASMGPLYKAYGQFIIQTYPLYYAQHFLVPNALNYYAPPVEFLSSYNSGKEKVTEIAQRWFRYKDLRVSTRSGDASVIMLGFYPILAGVMNVVFFCGIVCFFVLKGFKSGVIFCKAVISVTVLWIANAGFTIFASPAALRFQAFPVLLISIFTILLIEWICSAAVQMDAEKLPVSPTQKKQTIFSDMNM